MSIFWLFVLLICFVFGVVGGITSSRWIWNKCAEYKVNRNINHSRIHLAKWVNSRKGKYANTLIEFDGDLSITVRGKCLFSTMEMTFPAFSNNGGWRDSMAQSLRKFRKEHAETKALVEAIRSHP